MGKVGRINIAMGVKGGWVQGWGQVRVTVGMKMVGAEAG